MAASIPLRTDFSASDLRALAGHCTDANQARCFLSLAAVYDGMDRAQAARIGGMDRQTLRDWVHRFNQGLKQLPRYKPREFSGLGVGAV